LDSAQLHPRGASHPAFVSLAWAPSPPLFPNPTRFAMTVDSRVDRVLDALVELFETGELTGDAIERAVASIIAGDASEIRVAALLTALRCQGETATHLAAAVRAARAAMIPFPRDPTRPLLDTCGTGGDGARSLNISTATALIVAALGIPVAKHGNRSASGNSGSADVLERLGVNPDQDPATAALGLKTLGIAYLYAPRHHAGFRHAAPVRRALPFRTLFNLIGPLSNPAGPEFQLLGVPDESLADLIAQTLIDLGDTRRAAIVTGGDGLDEVTLDGPTWVRWVEPAAHTIRLETWHADDFGLPKVHSGDLRVADAAESARRIETILQGRSDAARPVLIANAAAALLVVGAVEELAQGVEQATNAVDSGQAWDLLNRWRRHAPAPTPN